MSIDQDTPKHTRGQREWTDAQRAAQGRKIRNHQIWLKSTGPKTRTGKSTSSRNSYKHGRFTFEKQVLRWYVRLAVKRLKQINCKRRYEEQKRENELRNKYGFPKPKRPDINAYYPYFKVHPPLARRTEAQKDGQNRQHPRNFRLSNHSQRPESGKTHPPYTTFVNGRYVMRKDANLKNSNLDFCKFDNTLLQTVKCV